MKFLLSILVCCTALLSAETPKPGETVENSLGMKLAYIPAGEFDMGSPGDEKGREGEEVRHHVKLTKAFRIGTTEVTAAQWQKLMQQKRGSFDGENLAAHEISWTDAVAFCEKLSKAEGKKYRLPTEAEWEYACRAGSSARFSGSEKLDELGWFDDNAGEQPHPVAAKKPNAWGLYDMHGNVTEWCADPYTTPYPSAEATDPAPPAEGKGRVTRGGSWSSFERGCRCASRGSVPVAHQLKTVGFRVVLENP